MSNRSLLTLASAALLASPVEDTIENPNGTASLVRPQVGYDDDDIGYDDEIGGEDDLLSVEGDDVTIGGDEADSEYGTLGARRSAAEGNLRRQLAQVNKRIAKLRERGAVLSLRRDPGGVQEYKVNRSNMAKANARKERLTRALQKLSAAKSAPTRRAAPASRRSAPTTSLQVDIDPAGGTPSIIGFVPTAAPAGDWAGAVTSSHLIATIPGGGTTANIALNIPEQQHLLYELVNLRVRISAPVAFGLEGTALQTVGISSAFPDQTNFTDLSPWDSDADRPLPSLRGEPMIIDQKSSVTLTVRARGVAADVGSVSIQGMIQILEDRGGPNQMTAPFERRPAYPAHYGARG